MPPPLPPKAAAAPAPAESIDDIDAQFERLEFGADPSPALTLDDTTAAATPARPPTGGRTNGGNLGALGAKRPQGLSFSGSHDDATESGQIVPGSLGVPGRVPSRAPPPIPPAPPSEPTGATTTEPPNPTDPLLGDSEEIKTIGPGSQPHGPETVDQPPQTSPGGADDDDYEDPTGADMHLDLESTHPGSDDHIVIADDLAESMDDETGTSPTVPPFTRNN